jgi:hypothetical protein
MQGGVRKMLIKCENMQIYNVQMRKCADVQMCRCADVQIESAHLHIYAFTHLFSVVDPPISPILRPF